MWHQAARALDRFPEVVITAVSVDGYPISVRQTSRRYDERTGEMTVSIPANLVAAPGQATLLAHQHDEKLWNLNAIQIKGRLERRETDWVFVSTSFNNPPSFGEFTRLWQLQKSLRRSADRYLAKRGLACPEVNWAAIKRLHRQAQISRTIDRRSRTLGPGSRAAGQDSDSDSAYEQSI
jgi:hypothetical protein